MEGTHAPALSPYHRSPEAWHWHSHLELGALLTAPSSARGHAGNVLREWQLKEFVDVTEMVVSELVTNSVLATRHVDWPGRQPPVRLWLHTDSARVLVHVWDAVPAAPRPRDAGPDDESGRGLTIVGACAEAWACSHVPGNSGKVTWALITAA